MTRKRQAMRTEHLLPYLIYIHLLQNKPATLQLKYAESKALNKKMVVPLKKLKYNSLNFTRSFSYFHLYSFDDFTIIIM